MTVLQVSVAPTNMIHLDNYYNRLQEHNKYQDPLLNTRRDFSPTSEDSPSIGQSLKDLFFPSTKSNRRVIKINEFPKPNCLSSLANRVDVHTKKIDGNAFQIDPPSLLSL